MNVQEPSLFADPKRWLGFLLSLGLMSWLLSGLSTTAIPDVEVGQWTSVLPPLISVLLAVFFRQLLVALSAGILTGAILAFGPNPVDILVDGFMKFIWVNTGLDFLWMQLQTGVFGAPPPPEDDAPSAFNLYIFGFTFGLVGMVHVMSRSGGTLGVVEQVVRMARTPRTTKIATSLMGVLIFFDDYANCVVVGTTMRSLSDRMRVSREKLAFLVDATAAPVSGLAIISTWIAFEVGLFQEMSDQLGLGRSGYDLFLGALPMRFYCLTTLAFIFLSSALARDYGPMYDAEHRAATTGKVVRDGARVLAETDLDSISPPPGAPLRWYNAAIPIIIVVVCVMMGMVWSGRAAVAEEGLALNYLDPAVWRVAFGAAEAGMVLFWSSLVGSAVAIALGVSQRIIPFADAAANWLKGIPAMRLAITILIMAWAIKSVCTELNTSGFLIAALNERVSLQMLPLATFLLASAISFATGTSWGTMGILIPVALPLAFQLGAYEGDGLLFLLTAGAVLDGAIFGDHCSPISDTTVLSSIGTGCDHVDHVRTQIPYAVTCMAIAALGGYVAVAFGLPLWTAWLTLPGLILGVLFTIGKKVPELPLDATT